MWVTIIVEVVDTFVFEESTDDTDEFDVVTEARYARFKTAEPADI